MVELVILSVSDQLNPEYKKLRFNLIWASTKKVQHVITTTEVDSEVEVVESLVKLLPCHGPDNKHIACMVLCHSVKFMRSRQLYF